MEISETERLTQSWEGRAPSLRHAISYAAQDVIVAADLVRNKQVSKRLMEHFDLLSSLATCFPLPQREDGTS